MFFFRMIGQLESLIMGIGRSLFGASTILGKRWGLLKFLNLMKLPEFSNYYSACCECWIFICLYCFLSWIQQH